jgi:hypothetical protein
MFRLVLRIDGKLFIYVIKISDVLGSQGSSYEDGCLVGCCAM